MAIEIPVFESLRKYNYCEVRPLGSLLAEEASALHIDLVSSPVGFMPFEGYRRFAPLYDITWHAFWRLPKFWGHIPSEYKAMPFSEKAIPFAPAAWFVTSENGLVPLCHKNEAEGEPLLDVLGEEMEKAQARLEELQPHFKDKPYALALLIERGAVSLERHLATLRLPENRSRMPFSKDETPERSLLKWNAGWFVETLGERMVRFNKEISGYGTAAVAGLTQGVIGECASVDSSRIFSAFTLAPKSARSFVLFPSAELPSSAGEKTAAYALVFEPGCRHFEADWLKAQADVGMYLKRASKTPRFNNSVKPKTYTEWDLHKLFN